MKFSLPNIPVRSILTNKRIAIVLGALLVALSLLSLYFLTRTSQDSARNSKTLSSKEAQIASLSAQIKSVLKENDILRNEDTRAQLTLANNTLDKYLLVKDKSTSYKASGVDTTAVDAQFPTVVDQLLAKKYNDADALLSKLDIDLETALKAKQAADAAKKTTTSTSSSTCSSIPSSGYCKTTIKTANGGSFTVYVVAGSVSSVRTDTGNSENCSDNCSTKSLQSYVSSNGGFAGINGTYFCPPDYGSCAGKVNSYDMPVYNSNLSKWINEDKMLWTNRAMMAFTSSGAYFYSQANSYSGLSGIRAGIVNFPGLVQNGQSIVGQYELTSAQNTKGARGGVAVKGSTIYLVVASSASVTDLANIMLALGVTHALNLDGGGSSALYYNGYKVDPGRSLPNALILK